MSVPTPLYVRPMGAVPTGVRRGQSDPPGAGLTDGCEPPAESAGTQTQDC